MKHSILKMSAVILASAFLFGTNGQNFIENSD